MVQTVTMVLIGKTESLTIVNTLQIKQEHLRKCTEKWALHFNELFEKQDGTYRVLYYRTQKTMGDGITTKDECTPLVFRNGNLVGWGDSAYSLMH